MTLYWASLVLVFVSVIAIIFAVVKNRFFFQNPLATSLLVITIIIYGIVSYCIWLDVFNDITIFVAAFLAFNSVLIALLLRYSREKTLLSFRTDTSLENIIENLKSNKKAAIMDAQVRVGQVVWQDKMLRTVNNISAKLFASTVDDFEKTLYGCMELVGFTLEVDRVYIWQNFDKNGSLHCGQVYEWSGGAEPQQGNEFTTLIPFIDEWYERLSSDQCVTGLVKNMSKPEQDVLVPQDIVSIMVVPIFINEKFWGFVGFDDCHQERIFSSEEEIILRSASLLFSNSYIRNEISKNLIIAKDEAQKSAQAKTDFLATISHEVRTPINAISGMSKIAQSITKEANMLECLNTIDASSKQLLSIINDILDMNKIESGTFDLVKKPFNLLNMVKNIQNIAQVQTVERSHSFNLSIAPDLPEQIIGDETRLSQVLLNLLLNAIKFTPHGGRIDFTARYLPAFDGKAELLEFAVTDTGIGISDEFKDKLFLKFEQSDNSKSREYGGIGLGLTLSKSIVDLMDGDIKVDSVFGEGSTFTVTIPVEKERKLDIHTAEPQKKHIDLSGKIVLLVEDVAINRKIIVTLLSAVNVIVDEAENGVIALEMLQENPSLYDAILMDVHMPLKDGYQTTQEIRALDVPEIRDIPIIAVTANAFKEDVEKVLEAGMDDHVGKPVNFEMLLIKLNNLLQNKRKPK